MKTPEDMEGAECLWRESTRYGLDGGSMEMLQFIDSEYLDMQSVLI